MVHHNSLKPCKERDLSIWLLRACYNLFNNQDLNSTLKDFDFWIDDIGLSLLFGTELTPASRQPKTPRVDIEEVLPSLNIPMQSTQAGRQTARPKHFDQYTT